MTRQFFIWTVSITLTALTGFGQTTDIVDWKIKKLKIATITETSIRNIDSIQPDTFPSFKAFYDMTGKIIEKRYDYRRVSLISKGFQYTSALYKYDKSGKLIDTKTINSWTPVISSAYYSAQTECKYFDEVGNLLKIELTSKNGANETTIYSYKEFTIKDNDYDWTTKLPIQINYYYKGHLDRKTIIEYVFY
jgi:hypothetical protein